jgi:SAM-dependent methyltransferase
LELAKTFAHDGAGYERGRPEYSKGVAEELHRVLGCTEPIVVLEIGCGSGLGTTLVVPIAQAVHGVDPSAELVEIARRRFQQTTSVTFDVATFERARMATAAYDVVFAAQSFHWVKPQIGFSKSARALKPGGRLALVWSFVDFEGEDWLRRMRDAVLSVTSDFQYWPDSSRQQFDAFADEWREAVAGSGVYAQASQSIVTSTRQQCHDEWRDWLATLSWFRRLSDSERQRLLLKSAEILAAEPPRLSVPVRTLILVAEKL